MTAPARPTEEALRSLSVTALVDAILDLQATVDDLIERTGMCEERERNMLLALSLIHI